jgi:hypothetical protein
MKAVCPSAQRRSCSPLRRCEEEALSMISVTRSSCRAAATASTLGRVNERRARKLAGRYVQAHGDQAVPAAYNWLANELVGLISDEAPAVFGYADGEPAVLPLEEGALVAVRVTEVSGEAADTVALECRTVRLGADANVALTEQIKPSGAVRERSWTFQDARKVLVVATTQQLVGRFRSDQGPHEGELLARAAAERLGWPVPGPRAEGDAGW